ncbi:serine/threonine phosphatase stp [Lachnospiraceae bacterium]|nr:serine/threonine phosphatase stp [Lachnospiraceae bacterium]
METYRIYTYTEKSRLSTHLKNEDSFFFSEFTFMEDVKIQVLAVADGMGGLKDGDKTSRNAIQGFLKAFYEKMINIYIGQSTESFSMLYFADKLTNILKESIKSANTEVCKSFVSDGETGTTLSVVCIVDGYAVVANVGDSPVYLYRAKSRKLQLISQLQTRAELEVVSGKYERYSSDYYVNDRYLYNSLGEYFEIGDENIYTGVIGKLEKNDMLLVGSDGAFGRLQDAELLELIDGCAEEEEGYILPQLFGLARMDKQDDQTGILYIVNDTMWKGN